MLTTDDDRPSASPAPPGLLLRAVQPTDAEVVAALANLPGYRWGTSRLPFGTADEAKTWIAKASSEAPIIVAVLEGQIVGSGGLERRSGRRAHVGSIGLGVHDAWTGRGVGRALMAALIDTADRWLNLHRLELTVFTDNAPALALYRRCGFVIEGTHRAYAFRDGAYADAHSMARLRGLPAAAEPVAAVPPHS